MYCIQLRHDHPSQEICLDIPAEKFSALTHSNQNCLHKEFCQNKVDWLPSKQQYWTVRKYDPVDVLVWRHKNLVLKTTKSLFREHVSFSLSFHLNKSGASIEEEEKNILSHRTGRRESPSNFIYGVRW